MIYCFVTYPTTFLKVWFSLDYMQNSILSSILIMIVQNSLFLAKDCLEPIV